MSLSEKRQQEIMRFVGEGSGDLERDEALALDEERPHLRKLHRERADFLRTCTRAEELDFFAANWDRDGREKPIHALIENPHVDAGTLLRLYWYSDPEFYYLKYRSASELDAPTDRDIFLILERIEHRLIRSEYKTASIPFDPKRHITMSGRRSEFARPIPEALYRPITRQGNGGGSSTPSGGLVRHAEPSVAADRRGRYVFPDAWLSEPPRLLSLVVRRRRRGPDLMSAFLDRFRPDPEFDGRRLWRTAKPLLRGAVVAVAPPYPDYPKLKVSRSRGPSGDPSCPSARDPSSEVEVALYASSGNGFGSLQERAWEFLLAHPAAIEAALRRKLFAWHRKRLAQFREEDLPNVKPLQRYWKEIERQLPVEEPAAIDHLFKLVAIGLADSGLDECGFSSFEFQTGWDRDHGLGVLMHRDRVLAAGGLTELIGGPGVLEGARVVQSYDLDEGDLVLRTP